MFKKKTSAKKKTSLPISIPTPRMIFRERTGKRQQKSEHKIHQELPGLSTSEPKIILHKA